MSVCLSVSLSLSRTLASEKTSYPLTLYCCHIRQSSTLSVPHSASYLPALGSSPGYATPIRPQKSPAVRNITSSSTKPTIFSLNTHQVFPKSPANTSLCAPSLIRLRPPSYGTLLIRFRSWGRSGALSRLQTALLRHQPYPRCLAHSRETVPAKNTNTLRFLCAPKNYLVVVVANVSTMLELQTTQCITAVAKPHGHSTLLNTPHC